MIDLALFLLLAGVTLSALYYAARQNDRADRAVALADYHAAQLEDADNEATDNEAAARHWQAAYERGVGEWRKRAETAELRADDLDLLLGIVAGENVRLTEDASRSLPAAPWPGEPLRVAVVGAAPIHDTIGRAS